MNGVSDSSICMQQDLKRVRESSHLLAIELVEDGYPAYQNFSQSKQENIIIGTILCYDIFIKCDNFRLQLINKVPSVPPVFRFLAENGWPIDKSDECNIDVSQLIHCNIIKIQKHFDLPRLGIKYSDGTAIGFIFVNFNSYLTEVRTRIISNLSDKLQIGNDFVFLERNGWPVSVKQELKLSVWDVCKKNYCVINQVSSKRKLDFVSNKPKKRPLKFLNKNAPKRQPLDIKPNSILISYVHCEATLHARKLKTELQDLGVNSVFLDIDDIPPGRDWQDVINDALNNCTAFVALVTPRYGETKWTNREAKLADDKEKRIIPVSFLNKWPPDQLAIQFLTLQYIPWKTTEEITAVEDDVSDGPEDINVWHQPCIHRVAKEIKKICIESDVSTPDSVPEETKNHRNGSVPYITTNCKKKCVVISAHSAQKSFVEKISEILRKCDYCVWTSVEMSDFKGEFEGLFDDSQVSEASPVFESYHEKYSSGYPKHGFNFFSDVAGKNSADYEHIKDMKFQFKQKVKEDANLVIIVMSAEYISSNICLQQAFYCEQRREVFVIKYGDFVITSVILNLYPEHDMFLLPDTETNDFSNLKKEITKTLNESASRDCEKDCIQAKVVKLSKELNIENCIYVIGGTSGVSTVAEQFCFFVGTELTKVPNLTLVTEGFFGAGDLVGKSFCEEKEIRDKGKPNTTFHILPFKDHITKKARQSENGEFDKVPYGKSLHYGDSIAQRDDIVSSAFKMCLLIEGGERTACLAEKFLWNDCILIPVIFSNRAILSRQCLYDSLKKVPCGVHPNDWSSLNANDAPDVLAKTVRKIVVSLIKAKKLVPKIINGAR